MGRLIWSVDPTSSPAGAMNSKAHHDVTWLADDTGAVTATLRYDPFGQLTGTTGTPLPDTRFPGLALRPRRRS